MLVQEYGYETPVEVFGIYWVDNKRFYWVIPYDGYEGFMSLSEENCEVIDPALSSDFILCKDGDGKDMLLHWAAEDLLHDLAELDPIALGEFWRRLGREAKDM